MENSSNEGKDQIIDIYGKNDQIDKLSEKSMHEIIKIEA